MFDLIEERHSISEEEDLLLIKHYERCHIQAGGKIRTEHMLKLIDYLETKESMK
ncbi:MAG TPA: hypothetical protein VH500_24765 [Nitrososphaeraceae archaeon]